MTLRNRRPLSSSFSTTTPTFFISITFSSSLRPVLHVMLVTHSLTWWVWLLIWLACEIGHDVLMMWSDKPAIQKTGSRKETGSQREEAYFLGGILIWSSLPLFFQLYLLSSEKEAEWQRQGEEDSGWKRVKETERKRQIRRWWRQSSVLSARPTVEYYTAMAQGTD